MSTVSGKKVRNYIHFVTVTLSNLIVVVDTAALERLSDRDTISFAVT